MTIVGSAQVGTGEELRTAVITDSGYPI